MLGLGALKPEPQPLPSTVLPQPDEMQSKSARPLNWVAVKELDSNYYMSETICITTK